MKIFEYAGHILRTSFFSGKNKISKSSLAKNLASILIRINIQMTTNFFAHYKKSYLLTVIVKGTACGKGKILSFIFTSHQAYTQ